MYFWKISGCKLKYFYTKVTLIFVIGWVFVSCNSLNKGTDKRALLSKNKIVIDGKSANRVEMLEIPLQQPNEKILGYRLQLGMYNLAIDKPDSLYYKWLERHPKNKNFLDAVLSEKQTYRIGESFMVSGWNNMLKEIGEPPRYLDSSKIAVSNKRFENYFARRGYFNALATSEVTYSKNKRNATVEYAIEKGNLYTIDSVDVEIESPTLKPLYEEVKPLSKIVKDEPYLLKSLEDERERLTQYFRDKGVYNFQTNNVTFEVDTVNTGQKANVKILIKDRLLLVGDTTKSLPFEIYRIGKINVFTEDPSDESDKKVVDSTSFDGVDYYSFGKLSHRPKALSKAIFIKNGGLYSDAERNRTTRAFSNLKVFQYPSIQYVEDESAESPLLIANIFLKPKEKYSFTSGFNVIHSSIEDIGFTFNTSLAIRNVLKGAEIFEISGRGNIGSSKDFSRDESFFNISEYGLEAKLRVPRLITPIGFRKWVPKRMFPETLLSLGFFKQQNIGLDKQNLVGLLSYNWQPKKKVRAQFDLFNVQYIRNVNKSNYFLIYKSSYESLNAVAKNNNQNLSYVDANGNLIVESGTNGFIDDVLNFRTGLSIADNGYQEVRAVNERKQRLTEDNLIVATNFQYAISSREGIKGEEDYFEFRTKIESSGLLLSLLSRLDASNEGLEQNRKLYNVDYSQYAKIDLEYIKHWDLLKRRVVALRLFSGIAIPYGNSTNIPFSRSYFGGGANDNRAWRPYGLGPGTSGSVNDFNEANFKLAANLEYRFKIYNNFLGGLFVDAGNIWNLWDDIQDEEYQFKGLRSLSDLAVGSGFGLRYDFDFFIFRADLGFKNYDPSTRVKPKWNKLYSFDKSVINIGINYPF